MLLDMNIEKINTELIKINSHNPVTRNFKLVSAVRDENVVELYLTWERIRWYIYAIFSKFFATSFCEGFLAIMISRSLNLTLTKPRILWLGMSCFWIHLRTVSGLISYRSDTVLTDRYLSRNSLLFFLA